MRFQAATIAALLLSAQGLPLSGDAEERLESIEEMVHKLVNPQATPAPTSTPSYTSALETPSQEAIKPPPGLIPVSDPKPVSDCLHRWSTYFVDPYSIFFYVPPTPYGYSDEPDVKLVMSISTRWGVYYTKQLRKKIEKQTGLVSIKEPEYSACGWNRVLDVKAAGVHRGDVDITRDSSSAVTMNKELKRKLEHILRTTYPGVEISMIVFFTAGFFLLAILTCRSNDEVATAGAHRKSTAISGTGGGVELHTRNTVPQGRTAASSYPPSYRSEL